MELLSVIRRWRNREHLSIRGLPRRTGLSRNTVRKYLSAYSIELRLKVCRRASKLDPYADKLSHMIRLGFVNLVSVRLWLDHFVNTA